jgi:hypothetical protein
LNQHKDDIPSEEYATLQDSVALMIEALETASHQSSDPVESTQTPLVHAVRTGKRGRPRIEIDPDFLREALTMRGPSGIAPVLLVDGKEICARTVQRRALDYDLVEPGHPVFVTVAQEDGTTARVHQPTTAARSDLSDEELDRIVMSILEVFPNFGRRMLAGRIASMGHSVTRERINDSYVRVHGPSSALFAHRAIHRRTYHVAGANSLWHHDGQHGKPCAHRSLVYAAG